MNNQVTILVHGTFANPEYDRDGSPEDAWWKITSDEHDLTTADRLQSAFGDHDAGDVWEPNTADYDINYEDLVEWDGLNKHRSRKRAGRNLAEALGTLATARQCTADNPLYVNFVAHSHGGNVVLEALGQLPAHVKPRQVSLLGTPVLWRYTDFRFLYLSIILWAMLGWLAVTWEVITKPGNGPEDIVDIDSWPLFILGELAFAILLFWLASALILLLRTLFAHFVPSRPAYGPPPDELAEILDGRPAILFISKEDEADLMMRLGAAPMKAYRALFAGRPSFEGAGLAKKIVFTPVRIVELVFLRPIVYVALAPLLEMLLERFGLGFPLHSVMVRNYEMISWSGTHKYAGAIETRAINADRLHRDAERARMALEDRSDTGEDPTRGHDNTIAHLRAALLNAIDGLKAQVHLSHSDYYDSQMIINRVAHQIVTTPDIPEAAQPSEAQL